MTEEEIIELYLDWIGRRIATECRDPAAYSELLRYLYSVDYIYTIPMDGNRADDGISLRYRFGGKAGVEAAIIASVLDARPCTMLEMMAALAIRCEEDIMYDPKIGDRAGLWFWSMVDSLGLGGMTNGNFDKGKADTIILSFLEHHYEPNGEGSLFRVDDAPCGKTSDMRRMELWNQMGVFLTDGIYI